MKTALFAILFAVAASAQAGTTPQTGSMSSTVYKPGDSVQITQVANRKGSKRVGGSGKSGKGSHYSGGRRR